ncbi:MAG: tRNA uracil 4-sulfurtransferase ThiI [Phoenicibacter congonensis]|uniref:Probable tRNA sulfurtransferase n=1 Tax=Phoenicibacter congonensis TaxID=1944646 RepID=A0AA43UB93_9ACTN|nr:tRNA uracil 4-sulfurtransferase ThiI [Phoenicibacter congonensis]
MTAENFQRVVLVHYHEIGLKGHNRGRFEQKLVNNIKSLTGDFPVSACHRISGRIIVFLTEGTSREKQMRAADFIATIPGVQRVSAGFKCAAEYDVMKELAVEALKDAGDFYTFKVQARRNHTNFEPDSMVMNREIGAVLCDAFPDKKVKMREPDVQVNVEVIENQCFICGFSKPGVGGLPVGSSGKVMCMLSSGIDSPVAAWKVAKRGAVCIGVHFSGRPQTGDTSEYLVEDIAKVLAKRGCMKEFYVCPIGDYQRKIALACTPKLRVVLYRRLMFRVANALAEKRDAKAIVTGESLGQVASQTMENMIATQDASDKMVLRPLIGFDKLEIIDEAIRLGTFEISSQDAADCCTLFMPKMPETHANLAEVLEEEAKFFEESWVEDIVNNAELHHV